MRSEAAAPARSSAAGSELTEGPVSLGGPRRSGPRLSREEAAEGLVPRLRHHLARSWRVGFALIGYTVYTGIGVWGNNSPVFWGFPIINFVFWVGIGHAGHPDLGDPLPLPQALAQRHRPLRRGHDDLRGHVRGDLPAHPRGPAVARLLALSLSQPAGAVAQLPLPPALGRLRRQHLLRRISACSGTWASCPISPRCGSGPRTSSASSLYTVLSLGWRGSASHWQHYEKAYLLLAGLATGLVLSVHSVVSFDFAVSLVPGWHMTIFPPYFVTGAIFAGFAMVVIVLVVVRETMQLKNLITMYHLDVMNKVILGMSCLMGYAYVMEGFTAWYSMNEYIHHIFKQYVTGTYGWAGWLTDQLQRAHPAAPLGAPVPQELRRR